MQLYLNDTSPFARLVLVTALEFGIEDIALNWVDPWASPETLISINPFSTVPTLKLDNGPMILESLLICQYLCEYKKEKYQLFDANDFHRFSIGKTLMEVSFRNVILRRFISEPTSCELFIRSKDCIDRTLVNLDNVFYVPPSNKIKNISIADICLALALSYIKFRLPASLNEAVHCKIFKYLDEWESRSSFQLTSPQALKTKPRDLLTLRSKSV